MGEARAPACSGEGDPYAVLGVDATATEDELRAARRRLAQLHHPDHAGGSAEAMRSLNAAFDRAVSRLGDRNARAAVPSVDEGTAGVVVPDAAPARPGGRVAHDVASFTIEALPAEAFEALAVVATWLGDVVGDDQPYQLDVVLGEPFGCWCRLDLVPDAGASTVALTLASIDGRPVPDLDTVRDAWVRDLNTLGRPD